MNNITTIMQEYLPDNTIFSSESPVINKIKNIIFNDLTEVDRRVLLIYAECASMEETGRILNVSASTIHKRMTKIREKITERLC